MDLLTKAKSIGSGGCESDGIEEEEIFSQDSGEEVRTQTMIRTQKGRKALEGGREENVSRCL